VYHGSPPRTSPVLETGAQVHLVLPCERDSLRPFRVFRQSPASLCWPPTRTNSVEYLHKHPRGVGISKVVTVSWHFVDEMLCGEVSHLAGYQVLHSPFDAQQTLRSSTTAQLAWKPEQMKLSLPQSVNTGNRFATGKAVAASSGTWFNPGVRTGGQHENQVSSGGRYRQVCSASPSGSDACETVGTHT